MAKILSGETFGESRGRIREEANHARFKNEFTQRSTKDLKVGMKGFDAELQQVEVVAFGGGDTGSGGQPTITLKAQDGATYKKVIQFWWGLILDGKPLPPDYRNWASISR